MTMQSKAKEKEMKQHEDVGKNHKNKSLMGPFKSLEAPGKYPLFPPPPHPPHPLGGPVGSTKLLGSISTSS